MTTATTEAVDHPAHYGGGDNPYEVIKVAEAWELDKDAYLFNVLKYIARAGKKPGEETAKDLKKARNYIDFRLATLEREEAEARNERLRRAKDALDKGDGVMEALSRFDRGGLTL